MRNFTLSLAGSLVLAMVSLPGCFPTRQDLLNEQQQRLAAQQVASATAKSNAAEDRELRGLRAVREKEQAQQIRLLDSEQNRLSMRLQGLKAELKGCRLDRQAEGRSRPHIQAGETRIWGVQDRALRTGARELMDGLMPQVEHCYQLHGWSGPAASPARGAFWLLYGLSAAGVSHPGVLAQRWTGISGGGEPTRGGRESKLQGCIIALFARQDATKIKKTLSRSIGSRFLRVAQLLILAPSAVSARSIRPPSFKWPWKRPRGKLAREREVCAVGTRNQYRVYPVFARPCAPGLQCCYPCGIPGCDSICMAACGPPRP